MAIEQAWLLKGFVLAHNAPPEVLEAAEALIADFRTATLPSTTRSDESAGIPIERHDPVPDVIEGVRELMADPPTLDDEPKKPRKPWSPEAREAAAARMRARQAAGLMKKGKSDDATADVAPAAIPPKQFTPVSVEKLQRDHSGYAGKRDPDQALLDSDWPDIKNMLEVKRMSVSQVASDYDVSFGTLRSFIDKHEAQEEQPLGEARAPSKAGA